MLNSHSCLCRVSSVALSELTDAPLDGTEEYALHCCTRPLVGYLYTKQQPQNGDEMVLLFFLAGKMYNLDHIPF
jgi:hypothetical protein